MFLSNVIQLAAAYVSGVWAQSDTAQCADGFDWNKNSLGQDPCTVGSILDASCLGLEYTYPRLNRTRYYLPPRANNSDDLRCGCNTVMYSLRMACTSCQRGQIYSWGQWVPQCDAIYVTQYPVDIAQGTAIPRWAYHDITSLPNETWNDAIVMRVGRDPEELPKSPTITILFVTRDTTSHKGSKWSTSDIAIVAVCSCISSFVILVAVIGNIPPGACQRLWERTRQQIPNSEAVQEEAP